MLTTFQALAVFVVGALPGALYVWGWERGAGSWGASASDRVFRFLAGSAAFNAFFAPVSYSIWDEYFRTGIFFRSKPLAPGASVPLWLWAVAVAYVLGPFLVGRLLGRLVSTRRPLLQHLSRAVSGPSPAPRAWDHYFAQRRPDAAWIRLKLTDGSWIGGLYGNYGSERSYASGFPHDQELYLIRSAAVNQQTGDFVLSVQGRIQLLPSGILVRWTEVQYMKVEEFGVSEK